MNPPSIYRSQPVYKYNFEFIIEYMMCVSWSVYLTNRRMETLRADDNTTALTRQRDAYGLVDDCRV